MARRSRITRLVAACAACLVLSAPPAFADEYESDEAGHPLRIVAYVLHPIGWFLDYFIFAPFHKLGNTPPGRVIFGHRDDFHDVGEPVTASEPVGVVERPAESPDPATEDSEI